MKRGTVFFFLTWTTINILFADAYGKVIIFFITNLVYIHTLILFKDFNTILFAGKLF